MKSTLSPLILYLAVVSSLTWPLPALPVPGDVAPGSRLRFVACIVQPERPGNYCLHLSAGLPAGPRVSSVPRAVTVHARWIPPRLR